VKLCVPTNFQAGLIEKLAPWKVHEVYGVIPSLSIGQGRPPLILPHVSQKELEVHAREAKQHGIRVNYLLNAACLDNIEFSRKGLKHIRKILDYLSLLEIESITVATPYLAQLIKRRYPQFEVKTSQFSQINTVQEAKYWEDLGVDTISVDSTVLNRELGLLKTMCEDVHCEVQLILNNACIYSCPYLQYHANVISHASQPGHRSRGFYVDYCKLSCKLRKLQDLSYYIRADWIRPEDVSIYESIGVGYFKLVSREDPADLIVDRVKIYTERKFNGNLLDLIERPARYDPIKVHLKDHLSGLNPFSVDLIKLYKSYKRFQRSRVDIWIDNRRLDGFLEYFRTHSCRDRTCEKCRYCHQVADEVIEADEKKVKEHADSLEAFLDMIIEGDLFRL